MKILLVGYYSYDDGYYAGGSSLQELGYDIAFFPLIYFINQDGPIEDLINVINGINILEKTYINYINSTPTIACDICLWWHNTPVLKLENLIKLKQYTRCRYIQLDWDPGFNQTSKNPYWNEHLQHKKVGLTFFDKILTCNANIIKYLRIDSPISNSIKHFNPGYNKNITYFCEDDSYKCDISIICTNLYDDLNLWENTKICRKDIVDTIYANSDINFHFYGPEKFKELYPRAYRGFISYYDCYKVFSNSIINLNISPVGNSLNDVVDNKHCVYMSERSPQILACKGLMVCDTNLSPLLIPDEDYIQIDNINIFISRINDILANHDFYDKIRNNGYNTAVNYLQWKDTLNEVIS